MKSLLTLIFAFSTLAPAAEDTCKSYRDNPGSCNDGITQVADSKPGQTDACWACTHQYAKNIQLTDGSKTEAARDIPVGDLGLTETAP